MYPFPPHNTHRYWLFALALACGNALFAQEERGSLTDKFPKLSPKERTKIAAKEADESNKDVAYQEAMHQAEKAFQEAHYEDALALYESARAMRPFNVYPKVKIEDLHALLAKQAPKADTTSAAVQPVKDPPVPVETAGVHEPTVQKAPVAELPVLPSVKPPKELPAVRRDPPPTPEVTKEAHVAEPPPLKKADGVIERRFKEGHAYVIERTVSVDGRTVVYKRVFHSWGQVFYFEDGLTVDERVWKARFPDQ